MNIYRQTSDGSDIYQDGAAADIARLDGAPEVGNLADVTKNNTVFFPYVLVKNTTLVDRTFYIEEIIVEEEDS